MNIDLELNDIRDRLQTQGERLARMEQRQIQIHDWLHLHVEKLDEFDERISNLEKDSHSLKTKLWLVGVVAGGVVSAVWQIVTARFFK
ncbi:MAG: hypothetical protein EBU96_07495 [Actinobacteria bacterium]|nr:hypothetical protein [Actinomycetota bacterium]